MDAKKVSSWWDTVTLSRTGFGASDLSCVVCFSLPRCMCHQGCRQAQRPAGRASWLAALCTSSLQHIWMYLRRTTNPWNQRTSRRNRVRAVAHLVSYGAQTSRVIKKQQKKWGKKEFLNDGESRRWVQDERRGAGGNNLRHLGRGKYLCGWETNQRPGLIREKSGESALRLLVKPLASRAARAPPGEHSRHP